jgi:hypothetical protein
MGSCTDEKNTDPVDGGSCPGDQILLYTAPGCGAAAQPVCGGPAVDACASPYCDCNGQTVFGCGALTQPFASQGPCADGGSN